MRKFYKKYHFWIHGLIILFEFFICFLMVISSLNLISPFDFEVLLEEDPHYRSGILGGSGIVLFCFTFHELCQLITAIIKHLKNRRQDLDK